MQKEFFAGAEDAGGNPGKGGGNQCEGYTGDREMLMGVPERRALAP